MSDPTTHLPDSESLAFLELVEQDFLNDPDSVPDTWRRYFVAMHARANGEALAAQQLKPLHAPRSLFNPRTSGGSADGEYASAESRQDRVDQLVRAYRVRGHMVAKLDPLNLPRESPPELDPSYYDFTDAELDRPVSSRTIKGPNVRTLRELLDRLRSTYCRYIGVQFMHIDEFNVRHWLQERMEGTENRYQMTRTEQYRTLTRLTDAVVFEEFIQNKFLGKKRFSLEGAESLIPLMDMMIETAGDCGINEIVIGMSHRGRLNVLANILGKSPRKIFEEFQDVHSVDMRGRGDVKYHLGWHGDWVTARGHTVHLALCFNPSHLEYVNPVALGRTRAKQDRRNDADRNRHMVVLIHGDAAFAGEGIVQETLQLSRLSGYTTGGTVHVIVNNQIGFTTSQAEARSSTYASGIGKMLQSPIFHVNGEDPESVAAVVRLAMDFRREFKRDVIIDMWCYRKRGHNESEEPAFTQPVMYRAIRKHPTVLQSYVKRLKKRGDITDETADEIKTRFTEYLEEQFQRQRSESNGDEPVVEERRPAMSSVLGRVWSDFCGGRDADCLDVDTAVDADQLKATLRKLTDLPKDFTPHRTLAKRFLSERREMADEERPLDWSAGEALAFATLVQQGTRVRVSGQDSQRGTFSHRHAVLHDSETGERFIPFQHLAAKQGEFEVHNSPLNEAGVLGFEYGYSIAYPDALVIWEAQFGDFANAAQVIIDQFITSAEDKWHSLSGLVMFLPHGFEGQGPEHSSARIERFLQLAAEDNIQVCNLTTPAQIFHCLRRQVIRHWRKPLVVFTPKSLLRDKRAVSRIVDLSEGQFQRIIPDTETFASRTTRVLLCSGKVYYDLLARREATQREDVAIVRLEQLYPIRHDELASVLGRYPAGTQIRWVQEEPVNMGAWWYLRVQFGEQVLDGYPLSVSARCASASPATGSSASHKIEQKELLDHAFAE